MNKHFNKDSRSPAPMHITLVRRSPDTERLHLPLAATTSTACPILVDDDGRPVWPVYDQDQRTKLAGVAHLFGSEVELVTAHSGEVTSRGGEVIGIGELESEVRLYAHLTGRQWHLIDHIDELVGPPLPEVVLMISPRLVPEIIQLLLLASGGDIATGLIWGRTRAELRQQILARSAAATLNGPVTSRRVDIFYGHTEQGPHGTPSLGVEASADALRSRLAEEAGVVTICSHGDGLSIVLSRHATLCGVLHASHYAASTHAPACIATGHCNILRRSIKEASAAGCLISPSEIAARLFVTNSCHAAFVGSSVLDSAWGFFPELNANWRIGAIVTTAETSTSNEAMIADDLSQVLAAGVPVGQALANYQRSPTAMEIGHRLLLFGDPRVRAAPPLPSQFVVQSLASSQKARMRSASLDRKGQELGLLRTIATHVRKDPLRDDVLERALSASRRTSEALARYESSTSADRSTTESDGAELRAALIAQLSTMKARPYEAWIGSSFIVRCPDPMPCPNCGWLSPPFQCTLPAGLKRLLLNCARCGNVVDRPLDSQLDIRFSLPYVELRGPRPKPDWTVAVFVIPPVAGDTKVYPWPLSSAEAPEIAFRMLPTEWPPGPLAVRAVAITSTALHVFGVLARQTSRCDRLTA